MRSRFLVFIVLFHACLSFSIFAQQTQKASPAPLNSQMRQTIIDEISKVLNANYVYAETAQKMESRIQTQLKQGAYDSITDPGKFAQTVHQDLRDVSNDKHLNFNYDPELAKEIVRLKSQNPAEASKARAEELEEERRSNYGFEKVERLDGNIGYLKLNAFIPAEEGGETASAALNFLSNCDALIVDLRENGGGDPSQIQLISTYFFESPTHLNDIYSRRDNKTENFWTLPYVPGHKMTKADIYVLTSNYTFSGAEEFTYNLKNLKRATIIGETTGGGAHPQEPMIVADAFILYVPYARAINPITKTNWEGTGVAPDVSVSADKAYDVAYRMAAEKLLESAKIDSQKGELEWALVTLKAREKPVIVNPAILQSYTGTYQNWKITLENGLLYFERRGEKFRLIPLSETIFQPESMQDFRLKFVVENGKATQVNGLYRDGMMETSKRSE